MQKGLQCGRMLTLATNQTTWALFIGCSLVCLLHLLRHFHHVGLAQIFKMRKRFIITPTYLFILQWFCPCCSWMHKMARKCSVGQLSLFVSSWWHIACAGLCECVIKSACVQKSETRAVFEWDKVFMEQVNPSDRCDAGLNRWCKNT